MRRYPPPAVLDPHDRPLLSWRVLILQYAPPMGVFGSYPDAKDLYHEFHLDEPWDSEHNLTLLKRMPAFYASPDSPAAAEGKTRFLAVRSPTAIFAGPLGLNPQELVDVRGTVFLVEVDESRAVPWTKPDDWEFNAADPLAGLRLSPEGKFAALTFDGPSLLVPRDAPPDLLVKMMGRHEPEKLDLRPYWIDQVAAANDIEGGPAGETAGEAEEMDEPPMPPPPPPIDNPLTRP
jgi:hypothetical protein